ncbi:MAG: hypothetical protein AABX13_02930 [Nanoarchaeota archaeon]
MPVKSAEPPPAFDAAKLYVWIRALEGKVNNLLREVEVLKNDFTRKQSELRKDVKTVNDDFLELRHQQEGTLQKMDLVVKELRKTAGREEVQVLKKYLELWSPLNFVTQRDVERVVESRLMPGARGTLEQKN